MKPYFNFERYELDLRVMITQLLFRIEEKWPTATQAYRAAKCGVATSTLYKLRTGRTRFPRFDTLWKLAQATGTRVARTDFPRRHQEEVLYS